MQIPPVIQTQYDHLPLTTQQRLKSISDTKIDPMKIPRGYLGGPITGLVFGAFAALATYLYTYEDLYRKMREDEIPIAAGLAFLTGALLVGCLLTVRRRKSAPVKSFWYVHPSYLIDAQFGNITAYPLLHLNDVKLTHHITNGVYQYTDIAMNFTGKLININYPGKEAAAQLARAMLGYSDKVRALAAQNTLESLPEHNLFTSGGAKPAPSGPKWYLEWLAGGLAAGVVGYVFLPALHNQAANHYVFRFDCDTARPATLKPTLNTYNNTMRYDYGTIEQGCAEYLKDFPDGNHVEEADDKLFSSASTIVEDKGYKSEGVAANDKAFNAAELSILKLEEYKKLLPNGRHIKDLDAALAAADDKLFEASKISILKLEEYKKILPAGLHIKDFDAAIAALYNQANEKYKSAADPSVDPIAPNGIEAMGRVIETLRDNKSAKVYLSYSNVIDFEGKLGNPLHGTIKKLRATNSDVNLDPVEPSFTPALNNTREQSITSTLTQTFGHIIPEEIMRFEVLASGAPAPADAVVVFDINYVIFPARDAIFYDKVDRSKGSYDVRFDWTFTIKLPKNPELKPFIFTTTSIAPDDLRGGNEATLYGAMAYHVFRDFGEHLKLIFGFPGSINRALNENPSFNGVSIPLDKANKKGLKGK